ncbi:GFA family protein [Microbulbifer sp. SAOS-129_SWC]|uniref:GFA family protein n=1 Tax=Microbulbifer sp. SAOS-129_SWC TaxID=3145235 RepID=UPI00321765E2
MKKSHTGSCHCGEVRFEVDLDLSSGTGKCNCSFCTKQRAWNALVPPQDFRLVQGEEALSDYQFGSRVGRQLFCRHCGVRPFARGYIEEIGGDYFAVNVAALDGVSAAELGSAPVRYFDGRHNNWQAEPEETAHL